MFCSYHCSMLKSAVLQYCLDIIFSLFLPTCISKIIKRLVITNNLNFTSDWRGYIKFSTFKHGQIPTVLRENIERYKFFYCISLIPWEILLLSLGFQNQNQSIKIKIDSKKPLKAKYDPLEIWQANDHHISYL